MIFFDHWNVTLNAEVFFSVSQILGGRNHGPSPHLKLWGDRPLQSTYM